MTHSTKQRLIGRIITLAVCVAVALSASAGVRRTVDYSTFINPHADVNYFSENGIWRIAGGVVFEGRVEFVLEHPEGLEAVPSSSIRLGRRGDGVEVVYAETSYVLETLPGIACPMARFIYRGGTIAFTIPRTRDRDVETELRAANLVRFKGENDKWIAGEFDQPRFEGLLNDADFFDVRELPESLEGELLSSVQAAPLTITRFLPSLRRTNEGWWINSDVQVTYKAYLSSDTKRVDVSGVPLRYHWDYPPNSRSRAVVFRISALDQNWSIGESVSNLNFGHTGDVEPTQYDIVSLWQTAAVFREVRASDPGGFESFVSEVCP